MLAQDRLVPMGTIGGRLLLYPPIIRQGAFGCGMTQGCLDSARHDGVWGAETTERPAGQITACASGFGGAA